MFPTHTPKEFRFARHLPVFFLHVPPRFQPYFYLSHVLKRTLLLPPVLSQWQLEAASPTRAEVDTRPTAPTLFKGGCCIDVYGRGDAEAAWRMGRIMLRFRPIAPKPVVDSSGAASVAVVSSSAGRKTRRKGSGGCRGRKARKMETGRSSSSKEGPASSSSVTSSSPTIVTLSLIPETPERKDDMAAERRCAGSEKLLAAALAPAWMGRGRAGETAAATGVAWPVTAVGSWVTVECVTDTWREGEVPWRSDEAVQAALSADDSPGFVSDEWGRVTWTNDAYRRMVSGGSLEGRWTAEEEEQVRVGLVARGAIPAAAEACRAFTCRVRVHYSRRPWRGKAACSASSLAAPCDVWRLDGGGSAWRLDVKAALSLSL
ncbi:hypothetical protein ZIOFF_050224 [Zingiber officinale]|uniref:DUF7950 domain-containing protein n=1 Tax=Zingiber officinale TaxID=94328 RepID=A0A8J5FRA7_ZINOF|nr:hypothetical protein ZIOFF_050224 [Zingiber officinale]